MLFDSHTHTQVSADSEMLAEDALTEADKQGLGLVFTEHLDLESAPPVDFSFDPEAYWEKYLPLRSAKLRLGIEVGMREKTLSGSRKFLERVPFDMVIGSIHFLEDKDIYLPEYYQGKDKAEAYHIYFREMAANLRTHDFVDVLGHIDYITRKAPYEDREIDYGSFQEDIDEVLRACLETDTVLELNTRRFDERRAVKELVPIYKRYREMGGKYVTLGSDAHSAGAIGAYFGEAQEFTEMLGLRIASFAERRLVSCG